MNTFSKWMNLSINSIRNDTEDESVLKKEEDCNLKNYNLYVETFNEKSNPSNKVSNICRFDSLVVKKREYLSVYAKGQKRYKKCKMANPKDRILYIMRGLDINFYN